MIESKLPTVGTTIFTVMSKLAAEHGAINLGQGFPGFMMDHKLIDLVAFFMKQGFNQYAPMPGVQRLREVISNKMLTTYGKKFNPETEVTITSGGTQALFTAITALVHQDDEVILFSPAYDCYAPAVEVNGGKCVWVELQWPDYRINWDHVRKLVNHKTRMILINTPHNPTGAIFQNEDMLQLSQITKGTDIIVLSDEVYEHIVFDQHEHQSVARFPELADRSLIVYSFGKTFHATGWKMGYICGPENLMKEFRKVHQYNVFSCNTPIQFALAEYMEDAQTYGQLPSFYQKKRDLFLELIQGSSFKVIPSAGTYFQLLSYESISKERDTDFAIRLTKEHGITGIPCSVFYPDHQDHKVLRFCFAKEDDELIRAAAIIKSI
jgi:methionine aminotransferase